ncbi:MAG: hypothetical protein ABSB22_04490 [Thermodesulfobacteriota bacterium]|jgi:hypothetical protein
MTPVSDMATNPKRKGIGSSRTGGECVPGFSSQKGEIVTEVPRLNQCFICKAWRLERDLAPVEVPDQGASYIQKRGCKKCLEEIMGESSLQDAPGQEIRQG